jgi:putative methionine-R-sulfoxide reductase with GAF domain
MTEPPDGGALEKVLSARERSDLLCGWMVRSFGLWPGGLPEPREREYREILAAVAGAVASGTIWRSVPAIIRGVLRPRGFEWNGIYARGDDLLRLFSAAGPPVCAELPLKGGVGASGMCWDAILMNQTVVAADVKLWPGYVSCDGESGLLTSASLVCPIRDRSGTPIAVWDLDATKPVEPADPPFFDRLFASVSSLLGPSRSDFVVA